MIEVFMTVFLVIGFAAASAIALTLFLIAHGTIG